jgi:hypothetical protein
MWRATSHGATHATSVAVHSAPHLEHVSEGAASHHANDAEVQRTVATRRDLTQHVRLDVWLHTWRCRHSQLTMHVHIDVCNNGIDVE